jgi:hypothetical protein
MIDITITGSILRQTDMAILFQEHTLVTKSMSVWLPRSQIAVVLVPDGVEITLPLWLAREKGLA